ncbi:probable serine/threonine-protein kinase DDB_G0282963 isoform X2 [Culicoides brevitarsis]|uniref:probable serine/threonine-protein kinase DDB_G0282963 isoform X2 n=1 Tax=Culicoides brevitarsis TaxID=469753 RepID=UPI00307B6A9C
MEDEIFDMEQVLGMDDSFCVNDNDVLKILKTWRLTTENEGAEEQQQTAQQQLVSSSKFFDSRTFTRPKKKSMQYPDYNFPTVNNQDPSPNRACLNLQIGGVLTNPLSVSMMQRSLITDVSPPNSLASSLSYNECGNSLITSGDFSNIGCFLNANNENEENMFMRGSTSYGSSNRRTLSSVTENLLLEDSKDNSILKTDMHGIEDRSSGNSTLQNSMELNNETFNKDDTFKVPVNSGNATFNTSNGPVLNQTFDQIAGNTDGNNTFIKNSTHTEENSLDKMNSTVVLNNDYSSPVLNRTVTQIPVQSTPSVHQNRMQKFGGSIVVEDLSPITTHPTNTFTRRNKTRLTVEQDDDNKRMSLQNFEDVEKSIYLLESTQDEEGFDVILEDITDLKRSLDTNEKFKQSLQNIKNRHSQANLERQQEEQFRKKMDSTMTLDNKLMDSMSKSHASMNSSGGSERLLNRRSRLDDGIVLPKEQEQENKPTLDVEAESNGIQTNGGNPDRAKNRDRFKTMRITKKHIEGMIVIDGEQQKNNLNDKEIESEANEQEIVDTEDINIDDDPLFKKPIIPQKPVPFRGRSLSKPKYYSGLSNERKGSLQLQLVAKASSIDHLDSNRINSSTENISNTTVTIPKSGIGILKSPMGAKSKSYHNLVSTNKPLSSAPKYVSRYGQAAMRSTASVKTAACEPNSTKETSRIYGSQQGISKSGFVRPSSGYQTYNNVFNNNFRNKNDSDPESGRYSPNSLCSSSASSRGSLHQQQQETHNIINSFEDISETTVTLKKESLPSRLARPSGLKQPTVVRSGLPRPTTYTKR